MLDISPTPEPTLAALYGNEHRYVWSVRLSAWSLLARGLLLPEDAAAYIDRAKTVDIGGPAGAPGPAAGAA